MSLKPIIMKYVIFINMYGSSAMGEKKNKVIVYRNNKIGKIYSWVNAIMTFKERNQFIPKQQRRFYFVFNGKNKNINKINVTLIM